MRHMVAVFARHSYQCSFDERADAGDLPQDRLAPRHEPIFAGVGGFHAWNVHLRINLATKKAPATTFSAVGAPRAPLRRVYAGDAAPPRRLTGATNSFSERLALRGASAFSHGSRLSGKVGTDLHG